MTRAHISALFIYPLKSARGVRLDQAQVAARGFRHDRRWMVVDEAGEFVTQRSHPELAKVAVKLVDDRLVLERPDAAPLELPAKIDSGESVEVRVWRDECAALSAGQEAAAWFSSFLGQPSRLVYMPDSTRRQVDPTYAQPGEIVSFADGYPFLLVEQASLDDLNERLDSPISMARFRPNIVVDGVEPFAADHWRRVRIGEVVMRLAKPCVRCVVTTTDQHTGQRSPASEPLRTLATFRRGDEGVTFGQNLIHEGRGVIRVGDAVEILE